MNEWFWGRVQVEAEEVSEKLLVVAHYHHHPILTLRRQSHCVSGVKFSRLIALINSAGGNTADSKEGMIDLDAKFSDGFGLKEGLKFVMGEGGANLRGLLRDEAITVGDLVFRNIIRKQFGEAGR